MNNGRKEGCPRPMRGGGKQTLMSNIVEHAIAKQLPERKRFATAAPFCLPPSALHKNKDITVSPCLCATVHERNH